MHEKIILAWLENDGSEFQYPDLYCFKSFETAFYAYFREFIHGVCKPVSYTHLDVYKRQYKTWAIDVWIFLILNMAKDITLYEAMELFTCE